jgi:hypothetical protein
VTVDRTGALGWGQRYIWLRHHQLPPRYRHEAHLVSSFDAPPGGVPLAMVRTTLDYLVRRHEALRSTYHHDTDGDPWQRVHPPGPLPLVTVSAEQDGTPTPAEVIERLRTKDFDLSNEWPIRACAVTEGGLARQLVLVLNHIAFDAWTFDRFEKELISLRAGIAAGHPAVLEPIRHQPLDLVRYEASARAAAAKKKAIRYWRDALTRLPADTLATRRGTDPVPVGLAATLTSPSILDTSRRIAQRQRVWPSIVHLATYTAVVAAYTGQDAVAFLSFTGNRGTHAYADVMTCMFSPLVMNVDCTGDPTFSELVRRAAECFERAQEHAYVPYDELLDLVSRESGRRGDIVRTGSEVNFLSRATVSSGLWRTRLAWQPTDEAWARYGSDIYLRICELRDAVAVSLHASSAVMDADAVERFLRGYEAVLLAHDASTTDLCLDEVAELVAFGEADPVRDTLAPDPTPAGALEDLLAVVRRVNGLTEVSPGDSYPVAGGLILRIPRVLALLAECGWAGLSVYRLAGAEPLAALAARLLRTDRPDRTSVTEPEPEPVPAVEVTDAALAGRS